MKYFRAFGYIGVLLTLSLLLLGSCAFSNGRRTDAAALERELNERTIHVEGHQDISLILYGREESREALIDFYAGVVGSRQIAEMILRYSEEHDVSASLAFSLAYAESSFLPRAVNRNTGSIDRGLFQLNSRSFPNMTEAEFFDPEINIDTGIGYLRYCLDVGRNSVTALAMYNAGRTRVTERGAPRMTLDYIAKILDFQRDLEDRIETSLVIKRTYLVKDDPKSPKRVSYILDKSKTVK